MARYSYNGWPVIDEADVDTRTEVVRVAGRAFRFAEGPAARVFEAFIARFAAEVEPIIGGELDDWSYAFRKTRGSDTSWSCHSSGTAVDLNSVQHPQSGEHTFTAAETKAVRRILVDFPVLRWGQDYVHALTDAMHFELNASPAEVAAFVASLNPPEDDMPLTDADVAKVADAVTHVLIPDLTATPPTGSVSLGTALGRAQRWALQTALGTSKAGVAHAEALNTLTEHVTALTGQVTALQDAVAALTPTPTPPG